MSDPVNNVTNTAVITDTRSIEAQAEMVTVRTWFAVVAIAGT